MSKIKKSISIHLSNMENEESLKNNINFILLVATAGFTFVIKTGFENKLIYILSLSSFFFIGIVKLLFLDRRLKLDKQILLLKDTKCISDKKNKIRKKAEIKKKYDLHYNQIGAIRKLLSYSTGFVYVAIFIIGLFFLIKL